MPILTIDSARLNGTPSAGAVRITASRSPLMDSGSNTVYSGTQTFPLDAQGKLSVSLPATDSPSLGAPFTYVVEANLASGQWIYRGVKLPANVATIDITDAQSASQQVYPTRQEWDAITAGMNTTIAGKVTGAGMTLRHDTRSGERVILEYPGGWTLLYGDTGWRVLTSWDESGTITGDPLPDNIIPTEGASGRVAIRRVLDQVSFVVAGATVTSLDVTFAMPSGFRANTPGADIRQTVATSNDTFGVMFTLNADVFLRMNGAVIDSKVGVGITFYCDPAWPTVLPGVPL